MVNPWTRNAHLMPRKATTIVALVGTSAAGVWLHLSPETQAAALAAVPGLRVLAPFVGLISYAVAAIWPQPALEQRRRELEHRELILPDGDPRQR